MRIRRQAEMLQKWNARHVAHIRNTRHFFRFVSPRDFFWIETREIFVKSQDTGNRSRALLLASALEWRRDDQSRASAPAGVAI
jgi:hypothetical protein